MNLISSLLFNPDLVSWKTEITFHTDYKRDGLNTFSICGGRLKNIESSLKSLE